MTRLIIVTLSFYLLLSPSASSNAQKERVVKQFHTTMISRTETDLGAPGLSAGDIMTAVSEISDLSGKSIGVGFVRKVVLNNPEGQPFARDVSIQYNLPGGSLLVTGVIPNYGLKGPMVGVELIIVGGTGDYKNKRGTALITPVSSDGSKYSVSIGSCC